ncbi:MAG: hypothetical protein ACK6BN_20170, partial [Pseudanabaena sp.]
MDSSIYRTQHNSRYWIEARAGAKTTELFAKATETAWQWAKASQYVNTFDGLLMEKDATLSN